MASEIVVTKLKPAGLMSVIETLATNPNVDMAKLKELLEMQERWEMNQAKKAFRDAMAEFSKNLPKIDKNQHVKFTTQKGVTEYDHATLDNVTEQIVAGLSAVGVSHTHRIGQVGNQITVTCILSMGVYSEETSLTAGPDESGGKNAIQAVISTTTYLRRHTLLAATGTATGMTDDDARGATNSTDIVVDDLLKAANMGALKNMFGTAYKNSAKRPEAQQAFKAAYETRKAELEAAQ